jgi:hypothetical protein
MQKSTRRNLLIALVVVVVILVAAAWWILTKDTVKFTVTQITPASGAAGSYALTLTGSTTSKVDPAKWANQPIDLRIKSFDGKLKSTVASTSIADGVGTVTTAPIAMGSTFQYVAAPSDYARILIMPKRAK